MSTESITAKDQTDIVGADTAIEMIIKPPVHDLGGFTVRRALPHAQRAMVGPWVFFDHMGPAAFPAGQGIDVRPHPHINIATVTYLFEGEMLHRDSLGNELTIQPGAINLMVAGKGIVHSERQRAEVKAHAHKLDGLQLWLALPEEDEETDPEFHHYAAIDIPDIITDLVRTRVLIGTAYGVTSPVKTFADTLYVEASLKAGQSLALPQEAEECAVYIAKGKAKAGETALDEFTLSVYDPERGLTVTATEDTRLAVVGGQRMSERYIWWNFVSSRPERIERAKADWRSGAFAKVPGDEKEFIPLPE